MLINSDFSRKAIVMAQDHRWVASPQPGVERVMLDRIGAERARATSLVRYQPRSVFPAHGHPGGEEILVLSGTFSDSSGDYGPGWYLTVRSQRRASVSIAAVGCGFRRAPAVRSRRALAARRSTSKQAT